MWRPEDLAEARPSSPGSPCGVLPHPGGVGTTLWRRHLEPQQGALAIWSGPSRDEMEVIDYRLGSFEPQRSPGFV